MSGRKSRTPACLPWVWLWALARLGIEPCGEEGNSMSRALVYPCRLLLLWHIVGVRRMNKRNALFSNLNLPPMQGASPSLYPACSRRPVFFFSLTQALPLLGSSLVSQARKGCGGASRVGMLWVKALQKNSVVNLSNLFSF